MKHLTDIEIFEYVEKISSDKEREKISSHIAECAGCREKVEFESALAATLSEQKIISPSANFSSRVMAKVVFSKDETLILRERKRRKISFAVWGVVSAAVIAILLIFMPELNFELGGNSSLVQVSMDNTAVQKVGNFVSRSSSTILDYSGKLGVMPLVLMLVFAALYGLDKFFSKKFFVK